MTNQVQGHDTIMAMSQQNPWPKIMSKDFQEVQDEFALLGCWKAFIFNYSYGNLLATNQPVTSHIGQTGQKQFRLRTGKYPSSCSRDYRYVPVLSQF